MYRYIHMPTDLIVHRQSGTCAFKWTCGALNRQVVGKGKLLWCLGETTNNGEGGIHLMEYPFPTTHCLSSFISSLCMQSSPWVSTSFSLVSTRHHHLKAHTYHGYLNCLCIHACKIQPWWVTVQIYPLTGAKWRSLEIEQLGSDRGWKWNNLEVRDLEVKGFGNEVTWKWGNLEVE